MHEKLIKEIWKNIACQASLVLEGFSGFYFFSPYFWVRSKVSRGRGSWRWRQENLSSCIQPLLTRGARWKYCQIKIIPEEDVAGWKCCWMKILPVKTSPDENIAFELFLGSRLDLSDQGSVRWCKGFSSVNLNHPVIEEPGEIIANSDLSWLVNNFAFSTRIFNGHRSTLSFIVLGFPTPPHWWWKTPIRCESIKGQDNIV